MTTLPDLQVTLRHAAELLQRGALTDAERIVAALVTQYSGVGDAWALAGEIAIRQGRISEALAAVSRAVSLEPESAERRVQQARCMVLAGDTQGARKAALSSLGRSINRLDHLLVLGGVLVRCGEHRRALDAYLAAAERSPEDANVQRGLASVYRFLGEIDRAEAACNAAIRADPSDCETMGLRSSLRTWTEVKNNCDELKTAWDREERQWRKRVHVAYALAKEHEDLGRDVESFEWLQRGASLKRRHTRYDLADDLKIFPALKEAYSVERLRMIDEGHPTDAPIFVLGMPRTGSTLVERIISSHSQVQNLGELNTLSLQMTRLVGSQANGRHVERLQLPRLSARLSMRELAECYLSDVASMRDGRPRFVDKLPLNCLNIGLIHLSMPNAAIVHVVRNPLDTCYAMYKYLFKHGYPFSYDLEECAAYYAEYHHLLNHWRECLPPRRILDVSYEAVVADLAGESRRLIAALGLPWEPACEDFTANREASTTGSASQVRRPIYGNSVGRWRRLERQLEPLRRALERRGVPVL